MLNGAVFQRVMREAHREYPFTGKKDADLIQKAVEVVSLRYMNSFILWVCLSVSFSV